MTKVEEVLKSIKDDADFNVKMANGLEAEGKDVSYRRHLAEVQETYAKMLEEAIAHDKT